MKSTSLFLLSVLSLSALHANDINVNLLAPAIPVTAGTEATVDVLWLNQGNVPHSVRPPTEMVASLQQTQSSWSVRLRLSEASPSDKVITLEPSSFARRTYLLDVPIDSGGLQVLAVGYPFIAQTMIQVSSGTEARERPPEARKNAASANLQPVASQLHRTVINNFGFHEPIYFIYGSDDAAAKFQISFRYRLFDFEEGPLMSDELASKGVYLAYTQRSLWNIDDPSSPFYDTSYMPELMFESLTWERSDQKGPVTFLGYQAGYRHESNGKDGADSRSIDIFYVRAGVLIGKRDGWRAIIAPRLFTYLGDYADSDNPNIEDYRGYGELLVSLGRDDGILVNITGIAGEDWKKGSVQVDASYPVEFPKVNFDTYIYLQYFDGYGECIKDYDLKSSSWRIGISLVR